MREAQAATIRAQYRFVDGYHVFTSEDVRGLYVASKDAREAFDKCLPGSRAAHQPETQDAVRDRTDDQL